MIYNHKASGTPGVQKFPLSSLETVNIIEGNNHDELISFKLVWAWVGITKVIDRMKR